MKLTVTLTHIELGHLVMAMHGQEDKPEAWLRFQASLAQHFVRALADVETPPRSTAVDPTVARFGLIGARLPKSPSEA